MTIRSKYGNSRNPDEVKQRLKKADAQWTPHGWKVPRHLDLQNLELRSLPDIFSVGGDLLCGYNNLCTLLGCPYEVGGGFSCGHNDLIDLVGGPHKVGTYYFCNHNKLQCLVGAPKNSVRTFDCSYNELTSLEHGPSKVRKDFHCSHNLLTTLKHGPSIHNHTGDQISIYNCVNNLLPSVAYLPTAEAGTLKAKKLQLMDWGNPMEGASIEDMYGKTLYPEKVKRRLEDVHSRWTPQGWHINYNLNLCALELEQLPKLASIHGSLTCTQNNLKTLKGAPKELNFGSFDCSENPLETLQGSPKKIRYNFNCANNNLKNLIGGPQQVGGSYVCSNNPLESLQGVSSTYRKFIADNVPIAIREPNSSKGQTEPLENPCDCDPDNSNEPKDAKEFIPPLGTNWDLLERAKAHGYPIWGYEEPEKPVEDKKVPIRTIKPLRDTFTHGDLVGEELSSHKFLEGDFTLKFSWKYPVSLEEKMEHFKKIKEHILNNHIPLNIKEPKGEE